MTQDEHQELSSRASARRDKMLPLLQQAMRERSRRRRRNKATAFSLLALLLVGVLMERFSTTGERIEELDRVVDAQSTGTDDLVETPAIRSETESPATASPDSQTAKSELAMKGADFQTIECRTAVCTCHSKRSRHDHRVRTHPRSGDRVPAGPGRDRIHHDRGTDFGSQRRGIQQRGGVRSIILHASHHSQPREHAENPAPRLSRRPGRRRSRHESPGPPDRWKRGARDGSISMESTDRGPKRA